MRDAISKLSLLVLSIYLIVGNLSRVVPLFSNRDNLSIVEPILYCFAILNILMCNKVLSFVSRYYVFLVLIITSTLIGMYQYGIDLSSNLYAVRLICMLLVGYSYALILNKLFSGDLVKFLKFFVCIYIINVCAGYLILLLFPDSVELWMTLKLFGIDFAGDPHQSRFVSTYFDPNFFSVIICIPILLCGELIDIKRDGRKKYYAAFLFLIITCVLTLSRSGLATMVVTLLILYRSMFKELIFNFKLSKILMYAISSLCLLVVILVIVAPDFVLRYTDRFSNMSADGSALHRLETFEATINAIQEDLLFGHGYNYFRYLIHTDPSLTYTTDSSILLLLFCFGLILSLILIGYLFICMYKKYIHAQNKLSQNIILYVVFCILFSSWFNELVDYSYWLIPVLIVVEFTNMNKITVIKKI